VKFTSSARAATPLEVTVEHSNTAAAIIVSVSRYFRQAPQPGILEAGRPESNSAAARRMAIPAANSLQIEKNRIPS